MTGTSPEHRLSQVSSEPQSLKFLYCGKLMDFERLILWRMQSYTGHPGMLGRDEQFSIARGENGLPRFQFFDVVYWILDKCPRKFLERCVTTTSYSRLIHWISQEKVYPIRLPSRLGCSWFNHLIGGHSTTYWICVQNFRHFYLPSNLGGKRPMQRKHHTFELESA